MATDPLGPATTAPGDRFEAWHRDGGGTYPLTLNALAVLPAVLALALVRPWGLRFPAWVPALAGRPVPRLPSPSASTRRARRVPADPGAGQPRSGNAVNSGSAWCRST